MDPHKTMSEKSDASTGRSYCVNFKLTHMENTNQPMQFSQSDSGDVVAQVPIVGSSGSLNVGDEPHLVDHAVESTGKNANDKRQRQRTSTIWNDFVYVEVGGMKKLQCKWCKRLFAVSSSSSTSTLGRHLVACVKYMESNKKQRTISFDPGVGSEVDTLSKFSFNESKVRELAAHMVLFHEYPFNIMEHELFNMFMRACTPHWKKISGATVRNECFNIYNSEKKKLKTLLSGVEKVNITTDMWTSSQKVSYMVVTCHFVDSDWFLQKRILNFCNVSPPHSGVVISDALRKSFVEWGIEDKIFTITADNASANDVAIRILKDEFELRGVLPIKGQLFHVRCCAHVTNLLVQAGIAEISHIIDLVREGIKYLVASEGRFREFSAIAKQLHLPFKKLILDVPTRWNSTYMMLATAIQFKDVFPRYYQHDQFFKWVVTPEQWEKVENVNKFLAIFNEVTNIVSGSEYPTSNLFLPEVWRMKEILSKSMDMNEYIKAMAIKMSTKFDKCWNECNLLMAIAAVLDPRYKMKLINFCFPLIYPEPDATLHIDKVLSCLGELYEVYVLAHNSSIQQQCAQENATSLSASTRDVVSKVSTGRLRYLEHIRSNNSIRPLKTDLDVYLKEDIYICENDENGEDIDTEFEALTWWKFNALKYRILSKMARDILAVPISTVASEAAFSAGSRVIEPHKASLSVETVQMLLCGSDWVRAIHGIPKKSDVVKMIEVDLPTIP